MDSLINAAHAEVHADRIEMFVLVIFATIAAFYLGLLILNVFIQHRPGGQGNEGEHNA